MIFLNSRYSSLILFAKENKLMSFKANSNINLKPIATNQVALHEAI